VNFWKEFEKIKRAHQYYLGFAISLPSFLSIIYENILKPTPIITIFPSFYGFLVGFSLLYIPLLWLMGGYFFERKPNRPKWEQAYLDMRANPWTQDLARSLYLLADGRNEDAKELLKKWLD